MNFNFYAVSKQSGISMPRHKASRQVSEYLIQLQRSKKTGGQFLQAWEEFQSLFWKPDAFESMRK